MCIHTSLSRLWRLLKLSIFFFNDTATTEIYTLSLHDALPISFRIPSIHPEAISVLVDDLTEVQIGDDFQDGIILTEYNNILSIHIHNESEYNHEFNYFLSDDSNWLENLTDTFLISAHRDTIISFEININEHPISIVNLEYNYLPYKQESTTWTIYQQCGANGYVLNECGVCGGIGGSGIPEGECDCDENIVDCAGECGGDAMEDECGVCGGDGIADGACDCDGNVDAGCGCAEAGPSGCDNACGSTAEVEIGRASCREGV